MHSRWKRLRIVSVLALVLALALGGLVVTTSPARADHNTITWYQDPWGVAISSSAEQHSTMFADGNGHVYVFYLVNTALGFTNLSVKKYSTALMLYGSPWQILSKQITSDVTNAGTVSASYAPSVGMDHSGNLYVAWVKQSGYTGGRGDDIYVSKSTDGGNTWLPPVLASASTAPAGMGDDDYPSLAVAPDGTIWVAWAQSYNSFRNITLSHSSNGAGSFTGFTNVSTTPGQGYGNFYPSLQVDSEGRLYLAYSHQDASAYWHIEVDWSDGGVTWTRQTIAPAPGVLTFVYYPKLLVERSGYLDVAWWDNSFPGWGGNMIWFRRSADRGATWLPAVQLASANAPATLGTIGLVGLGSNLMVTYPSFDTSFSGIGWAVSADDGQSWYPSQLQTFGHDDADISPAMDENGTVWASATYATNNIEMTWWNGPPSPPVITAVTSGATSLTVTWSAPPEKDVASYELWRSLDGSTYQAFATVAAPSTSFTDSGLANGTYWYKVTAVDSMGTPSHDSAPASGTVGLTTQQLIANLQSEIASLQNQLAAANASSAAAIAAAQAQITSLQNALTNLQNSETTSNAATAAALARLQANLTDLQNQLNNLQSQQATQTISYANLAFEVIVVVLLVVLLLNQMRKPKVPQMMMAEPAQAPKKPEDDL